MPRKLFLEPEKLRAKINNLRDRYNTNGEGDILRRVGNLYQYCFFDLHSYEIHSLKNKAKQLSKKVSSVQDVEQKKKLSKRLKDVTLYPFLKGGTREYAMVYVHLLAKMLRDKQSVFWDDAIFIIYFTYYTGFCYDSLNKKDFNYDTLYLVDKYNKGLAQKEFKEAFSFVRRYNFREKSSNNEKIKSQLIDKEKSFNKKFNKKLKVEAFRKLSEKIIKNGL